ncbi:hypothetical protein N0U25_07490 [Pseudomonas sivasensis]|uniref:hypothetical protein n=1 Tax=Pseudomonas sivasensis TaxID=1880678 RepID=UPI0021AA0A4C|nr:hypothetical protein [Pseudomonas sivasensis]MCT4497631.1 hypothetical protein [Pseudomonas sivasensis]
MKTQNIIVIFGGTTYSGWAYTDLPLGAALVVASAQIEEAADLARSAALGDPLRAVELDLAASEAKAFAAAGYEGDVPLSVQAWVDAAGLSPQAATESILAESAAWIDALQKIRAARLKGKQGVLKAISHSAAEALADKAIEAIQASVAGIGNA